MSRDLLDIQDNEGMMPFHYFIKEEVSRYYERWQDIFELLMTPKNILLRNKANQRQLNSALQFNRNSEMWLKLLENMPDDYDFCIDPEDGSLLHIIFKKSIKKKVSISVECLLRIVNALQSKGYNSLFDIQDEEGMTPFHYFVKEISAYSKQWQEVFDLLVTQANILLKNKSNETPLDSALQYNENPEVWSMLLRSMPVGYTYPHKSGDGSLLHIILKQAIKKYVYFPQKCLVDSINLLQHYNRTTILT